MLRCTRPFLWSMTAARLVQPVIQRTSPYDQAPFPVASGNRTVRPRGRQVEGPSSARRRRSRCFGSLRNRSRPASSSDGDRCLILRPMRRNAKRSDAYEGPGCETGLVIVPAVVLIALISALVVAVTDVPWNGALVGFAGVVSGIAAWLGLWELFSRLHPRFSQGSGETVKWLVVVCGPPLLAFAAVVLLAIRLRTE